MRKKTITLWLLCLFAVLPMGATADTMEYTLSFSPSDYEYIYVGRNVTTKEDIGNVTVKQGSSLKLKANKEIMIKNGFSVESGGTFEMDIKQ